MICLTFIDLGQEVHFGRNINWAFPQVVGLYVPIFFVRKCQKRISTAIPNAGVWFIKEKFV